jgi:hypothetical protein
MLDKVDSNVTRVIASRTMSIPIRIFAVCPSKGCKRMHEISRQACSCLRALTRHGRPEETAAYASLESLLKVQLAKPEVMAAALAPTVPSPIISRTCSHLFLFLPSLTRLKLLSVRSVPRYSLGSYTQNHPFAAGVRLVCAYPKWHQIDARNLRANIKFADDDHVFTSIRGTLLLVCRCPPFL